MYFQNFFALWLLFIGLSLKCKELREVKTRLTWRHWFSNILGTELQFWYSNTMCKIIRQVSPLAMSFLYIFSNSKLHILQCLFILSILGTVFVYVGRLYPKEIGILFFGRKRKSIWLWKVFQRKTALFKFEKYEIMIALNVVAYNQLGCKTCWVKERSRRIRYETTKKPLPCRAMHVPELQLEDTSFTLWYQKTSVFLKRACFLFAKMFDYMRQSKPVKTLKYNEMNPLPHLAWPHLVESS